MQTHTLTIEDVMPLAEKTWNDIQQCRMLKSKRHLDYRTVIRKAFEDALPFFEPELIPCGKTDAEKFAVFFEPILRDYLWNGAFGNGNLACFTLPVYWSGKSAPARFGVVQDYNILLRKTAAIEALLWRYADYLQQAHLEIPERSSWRFDVHMNSSLRSEIGGCLSALPEQKFPYKVHEKFFLHQAIRDALPENVHEKLGDALLPEDECCRWLIGASRRYRLPRGTAACFTDENGAAIPGSIETIYPCEDGEPLYFIRKKSNGRLVLVAEEKIVFEQY